MIAPPASSRPTRRYAVAVAALLVGGLAIAAAYRDVGARTTLSAVEADVRAGDFTSAAQAVERYTRSFPDDATGWRLQGRIYDALRDYQRSAAAYQRTVQLAPDDADVRRRHGLALLQSAQFSAAESAYRGLLNLQPTDEHAQTELQWILFHQLRERELERFLEECLAREPASFRLLYHLLVSAHKRPNAFESMPVLERINAACPNQPSIMLGLARCSWKIGDVTRARRLFETVRSATPDDRLLLQTLAEFELEQLHTDVAGDLLKKLERAPDYDVAREDRWWWLQGQLAQQQQRFDAALESITRAGRLDPRSLEYLQGRTMLLRLLGRGDEARPLQELLNRRQAADRALSIIVESGRLESADAALALEVSEHCRTLGKDLQADGWRQWSTAPRQSATP